MLALIIGRRRQGKSTLALALALMQRHTVIVFDPNDQYAGFPAVSSAGEVGAALERSSDGDIIRYLPAPPVEEHWQALADLLDGGTWEWADYTLILDEASMLMSPHYLDEKLERFARTAPKDISLILTTHRPRDIHPLFRALATDLFCFQTTLALDVKVLQENYGAELASAVQRLGRYQVAHYWLAEGGTPMVHVWDKPSEWFIDIGRKT
jgi:hypothetical protein